MTAWNLVPGPDPDLLASVETLAVELARLGGAQIETALGGMHAVAYKGTALDPTHLKDPVSEVDSRVEALIRARLAERFPTHDIIGEEMDERPGRGHDWVWAVDPIDGTTNFVNTFPLFASSVGVLFRGRPVAGAVWCSSSHRLAKGVYHASAGGALRFDGEVVPLARNPAVRRRLAGEPDAVRRADAPWEVRKTGSAAIECAFVAAGLLQVARFGSPNLWDVAGGVALVEAAGGVAYEQSDGLWQPLAAFEHGSGDLGHWRRPVIVGEPDAARTMVRRNSGRTADQSRS